MTGSEARPTTPTSRATCCRRKSPSTRIPLQWQLAREVHRQNPAQLAGYLKLFALYPFDYKAKFHADNSSKLAKAWRLDFKTAK